MPGGSVTGVSAPDDRPPRDIIWAPWRMSYLDDEHAGTHDDPACVFCAIGGRPPDDARNYVLARAEHCFAVLNLYPYNNGHLMVIPYRHVPGLLDLDDAEVADVMAMARRAQAVVADALQPHGFNLGMNQGRAAGAGIPDHLHVHLLPRWNADTNFMTPLAGVRVMPQSLDDSYALLLPGFAT